MRALEISGKGGPMVCQDIMKQPVECVSPSESVNVAARRMRDENVGFLPVCDETKRVLGTLTDRDIALRGVAEDRQPNVPVGKIMSHAVIACRPSDSLRMAEQLMRWHQKSRIMCIDGGRLVGIISISDVAQLDGGRGAKTLRYVTQREARF